MNKNLILSGIAVTALLMSGCGKHETSASLESEDMAEDMNSTLSNEVLLTPQEQAQPASANLDTVAPSTSMTAPQAMAARDSSEPYVKPTNKEIQQSLKNAGIYDGKVDGVVGPRTKKAIADFQAQNSLNADGRVGPQTWAKLGTYLNKASQAAPAASAPAPDVDN